MTASTNTPASSTGVGAAALRAYVYLDRMQPNWTAYVAQTSQDNPPAAGMAQLYIEVYPATLVFPLANEALKNTDTQSSMLVAERQFGTLELHADDPDAVKQAGAIILDRIGVASAPATAPTSVVSHVVSNVTDAEAQLVNKMRVANLLIEDEAMLVLEVAPAAYTALAANEAEKHTELRLILVSLHGASGRLILSGSQADVDIGHTIVMNVLDAVES